MRDLYLKPGAVALLAMLSLAACSNQGQSGQDAASTSGQDATASPSTASKSESLNPGRYDKILSMKSDDGQTAIGGVLLDGVALKTEGLGTPSVKALLVADPEEGNGTLCETEGLEIRLENGVIYRPLTNICNGGYDLNIPAQKAKLPNPLPKPPEEFAWVLGDMGDGNKIVYFGIPETDATAFMASCQKGSGRTELRFIQDSGQNPVLDLYSSDRVLRYGLRRISEGSSEEAPANALDLSADDAFWVQLRRGSALTYRINNNEFASLDTRGGVKNISTFLSWCSAE